MTDLTNLPDLDTDLDTELEDLLEQAEPHTLLEVWRELLSNIEESAAEKVPPAVANRIVGNWTKLSFQDVPAYHTAYHALLVELRAILHDEIAKHPGALKNVETDAEENREIYIELLFRWQERIAEWEHAWDAGVSNSHITLAAIADATSFFVGQQGLVEHLSQIGFQFGDEDRDALAKRLVEAKAAL